MAGKPPSDEYPDERPPRRNLLRGRRAGESPPPAPDPEPTRRARRVPPPAAEPTRARGGQRPPLPPEPPPDDEPRGQGLVVPWWAFVIVILVVAAVTCGMWYLVLSNRGDAVAAPAGPSPTPIFLVITATPTLGAPGEAGPNETPIGPTAAPTGEPTVTPTAAEPTAVPIEIGGQIVVIGTEGAGLAVRQGPGVDFAYLFVADDGDVYNVQDGPASADGYDWWYIVDPADEDRAGWAVSDYMDAAVDAP
jgi:hypothetical protein